MSMSIDEVANRRDFTSAAAKRERTVTFLPEPDRRARRYTIISVDDHVVEPPDTFTGRMPVKFAQRAPRVVTGDDGGETWVYDDVRMPQIGFSAVVGRPSSEYSNEPTRYDEMRRGAWDVHARVADMDLDGVYASLNFPSFLAGFGGGRLQTVTKDLELALATVRAWNDWHLEAWCGAYPDRFIPSQLPWLHDPVLGAEEIRRNAARGLPRGDVPRVPGQARAAIRAHRALGPRSWRRARRRGPSSVYTRARGDPSPPRRRTRPPRWSPSLFGIYAMMPAADWLFSLVPVRFPGLRICMSEGGIGWVAGMLDRLDHIMAYQDAYGGWVGTDLSPSEVFQRNFWFCALDNPSSYCQLERIGVENVMCEVDYPHPDTTWPNTQPLLARHMESLPAQTIESITWRNASNLFRHPVPLEVQRDPNAY